MHHGLLVAEMFKMHLAFNLQELKVGSKPIFSELHSMNRPGKMLHRNAIVMLGIFSFSLLLLFGAAFIGECDAFFSLLDKYVTGGTSMFIPDLPSLPIAWFTIQGHQPIAFTWGHVVDAIIIMNILLALNRIPYECYCSASMRSCFIDMHMERSQSRARVKEIGSSAGLDHVDFNTAPSNLSRVTEKIAERSRNHGKTPAIIMKGTISKGFRKANRLYEGIMDARNSMFTSYLAILEPSHEHALPSCLFLNRISTSRRSSFQKRCASHE
jgi:hypothetical protein